MAGDGGAAHGPLIARCGHSNNAAFGHLIEGLLSLLSPSGEGRMRAELRLMTRAPVSTLSVRASARSSGLALGICPLPLAVSAKLGRSNVHPGQIAGATEPRLAESIPATNVPCVHATVAERAQVRVSFPGISRMVAATRSERSLATGQSISAAVVSGRPDPSFIKSPSRTKRTGLIVHPGSTDFPDELLIGIQSEMFPPSSDEVNS